MKIGKRGLLIVVMHGFNCFAETCEKYILLKFYIESILSAKN